MKLIIKITLVTLVFSLFGACSTTKQTAKAQNESNQTEVVETKAPINKNVSASEFKTLIDSGKGLLLDVRTPNEVAQGSIKGNTNIDYFGANFKTELAKLDKNKPVYVYCRSGNRSGKSMQIMTDMGFKEVYNLIGGYSAWPYK